MVGDVLPGVPRTSLVSNKAAGVVGWDMEPREGVLPCVIFICASHSIFDIAL